MRLLIVEDSEEILNSLKAKLQRECFSVDTAKDGVQGAYLAQTNDYDLIISELFLPNKNGLILCSEIRERGKTVPIIMLSAETDTAQKITLLNAGADDYLTKPFSFEELLARIRAVLRRPRSMVKETLALGDMFMDVPRHRVQRANRDVYLTKKEFELLEYLLRNQGQVLSRGMLLEHVWDNKGDIFSNTIETHILNLRKKLDKDRPTKLIYTIPGRGYKIDTRR